MTTVRTRWGYRTMKPRDAALRLKRFEASEKARKVASIETMILDFEHMAADLSRQIAAEEERTGIKDPAHFAYSTFAKAAGLAPREPSDVRHRFEVKLDAARQRARGGGAELRKLEPIESRDTDRHAQGDPQQRRDRLTLNALDRAGRVPAASGALHRSLARCALPHAATAQPSILRGYCLRRARRRVRAAIALPVLVPLWQRLAADRRFRVLPQTDRSLLGQARRPAIRPVEVTGCDAATTCHCSGLVRWRPCAGACTSSSLPTLTPAAPAAYRDRLETGACPSGHGAARDGDHRAGHADGGLCAASPAARSLLVRRQRCAQGHPCLPCRGRAALAGRPGRDRAARARCSLRDQRGARAFRVSFVERAGGVRVGITAIKIAPALAEPMVQDVRDVGEGRQRDARRGPWPRRDRRGAAATVREDESFAQQRALSGARRTVMIN